MRLFAQEPPLTLERALAIASQQSPLLAAARAQVSGSSEAVREARASLYPRLGTEASYLRLDDPPGIELSGAEVELGRSNLWWLDLGTDHIVWSGGEIQATVEAAARAWRLQPALIRFASVVRSSHHHPSYRGRSEVWVRPL